MYIEPGSPWENGYCESFNSKMREEFLNGEIFYSITELRVLAERWRKHYNTVRPHSSLGIGHQHQKRGWHPLLGRKWTRSLRSRLPLRLKPASM